MDKADGGVGGGGCENREREKREGKWRGGYGERERMRDGCG